MSEYVTNEYIKKQDMIAAIEIERDYLLKNKRYGAEHILVHHALRVADKMVPEENVVKVTLCKDCRFAKGKTTNMWGNPAIECETGELHEYEWFCASAEPRKEESDGN